MSCNTANEDKKYLSTVHDSIETPGSVTFNVDEVMFLLQMKDSIIFCIFRNMLSPAPRGRLFSAVCIRRSTQAWTRFLTKLAILLRQAYAFQSSGGHSQEKYADLPNACEVDPVSSTQDDYHWKEYSWWLWLRKERRAESEQHLTTEEEEEPVHRLNIRFLSVNDELVFIAIYNL